MEYHPGGVDELMRGAGMDATDLFDEVNSYLYEGENAYIQVLKAVNLKVDCTFMYSHFCLKGLIVTPPLQIL